MHVRSAPFSALCAVLCAAVLIGCSGALFANLPASATPMPVTALPAAPAGETILERGVLRVDPANPRYFRDGKGSIVYLTGSHTWMNLQDLDTRSPVQFRFDYNAYLNSLITNQHNFMRLWVWEEVMTGGSPDYYHDPMPYLRTGPGTARDRLPRFDLTQFNQAYFDRLRERVLAAGQRNIYVSIMLFNGWSVENKDGAHDGWTGHPFNRANNANNINGDPNGDGSGRETHTLAVPAVTALQIAYIHKVIDTVGDLDNVLYEISNESDNEAAAWQNAMIDEIKKYEATRPKQHPVGMTSAFPGGDNNTLFNSRADWISVNGDISNPIAGDGRKVILYDTDHLCGTCGDRQFVWKALMRGLNPILMDPYGWTGVQPSMALDEPNWEDIRKNMGYARRYANRANLPRAVPRGELASSGYALANPAGSASQYLVYLPTGGSVTVDLSEASGTLRVEWFNPADGTTRAGGYTTGGRTQRFTSPFSQDAVLYLYREYKFFQPVATMGIRAR